MAHTSPFHRRKWAGYLSGYRILPAIVALFIVPFGGEWHIPSLWDGEMSGPVTVVLIVTAMVLAVLATFIQDGRAVLIAIAFMGIALTFLADGLGGVDDFTINGYMVLFVLTALAPITDVLDGHFAAKYPRVHDEDFFIWNTGKEENDNPNAFYFILVPAALTIRFFLEQLFNWDATLDPDYLFWGWVVLSAVLLGGTLLFNAVKTNAVAEQARIGEVLQGWLAGLFYFLIPLQFAVLAFCHWSWVWQTVVYAVFAIGSLVLVFFAQDRWFDRPESDYSGNRRVRY